MECVRKLVYAENTDKLEELYQRFKEDAVTQKYENFKKHLESYWEHRDEWAICFRDQTLLRGNNTNNYAESGIRILKDIVFKRVKAYNLVQLFELLLNSTMSAVFLLLLIIEWTDTLLYGLRD